MTDKPALNPQGSVGDALRSAAYAIIADARAALNDPKLDDATAIHDFRKAMKRWRALLRLLERFPGMEAHSLRMAARDLARTLAGPRDAQSALDALKDAVSHDPPDLHALSPRVLASIRSRLEEAKTKTESAALTPETRATLAEALVAADSAIDLWPLDAVTFNEIADELAAGYRRARRRIPENWSRASPEELHELRQRVVEHRHQMELVEPLWPRLGKLWVEEAQRLRNRLGNFQDLVLLSALAAPRQPLARWQTRIAPLVAARQAAHKRAAARLSARLFAEAPNAFQRRLIDLWRAGQSV